jgi:hypothetical protein
MDSSEDKKGRRIRARVAFWISLALIVTGAAGYWIWTVSASYSRLFRRCVTEDMLDVFPEFYARRDTSGNPGTDIQNTFRDIDAVSASLCPRNANGVYVDGWGSEFLLEKEPSAGAEFLILRSLGEDRTANTSDDIVLRLRWP